MKYRVAQHQSKASVCIVHVVSDLAILYQWVSRIGGFHWACVVHSSHGSIYNVPKLGNIGA